LDAAGSGHDRGGGDRRRGLRLFRRAVIDMARAMLEHGNDPEIRALAEEIIAAQEQEIAFLRSWLEKHAQNPG
jgi:hypothetical protein